MPPRIPGQPLLNCTEIPSLVLRPAIRQAARTGVAPPCSNSFSTTSRNFPREIKILRLKAKWSAWMDKTAPNYKDAPSGRTNYVTGRADQPFPLNPTFKSLPVLSDDAREQIWREIRGVDFKGKPNGLAESFKGVAAKYSIDVRRVAAVFRMKEIEKRWENEGKPLATPYARAVMGMLPQTRFDGDFVTPHEPINEIHVHGHTMQQLFVPTSESRHFTREDAAKAFSPKMLSADKRMPVPELVQFEKDILLGKSIEESEVNFKRRAMESEMKALKTVKAKMAIEESKKIRVDGPRFEYRFKQINSDNVGRDGRSRKGVGARYGVPHYDRRRGEVKIPTKVE